MTSPLFGCCAKMNAFPLSVRPPIVIVCDSPGAHHSSGSGPPTWAAGSPWMATNPTPELDDESARAGVAAGVATTAIALTSQAPLSIATLRRRGRTPMTYPPGVLTVREGYDG